MKKIDYELLNEKIEIFLYEDFPVFEEDFIFENRLCDIILREPFPIAFEKETKEELYETKNKVSYNKTITISLEMLKKLDLSYALKLQELINQNSINFKRTNNIDEKSYVDILTDDIQVVLLKKIEDALSLVHEFMHYMNSRSELSNGVTSYYTECFSNLIEFLLVDYINDYYSEYQKDAKKMKRNIFISLYQQNIITKILTELVKKKINGKVINPYELADIINNINQYGVSTNVIDSILIELLEDICVDDEYSFEDTYILSIRNTVALLISCYMYDYLTDNKKQKEIFDLSDHLSELDLKQVLLYLNLEFKDVEEFDLTEESYKKLEYSYKNNLKKLW